MTRLNCLILGLAFLAALLASTTVLAQAPAQEGVAGPLAELITNIASEDAAVREQAFERLYAMGREGVEALLGILVPPGEGDDAGARFALHGMAVYVSRPEADASRGPFVNPLMDYLGSDAPAAVKQFVIAQLQIAGGAEAIPALARCLTDDDLAASATQALTANPSPEAPQALRDALPNTQGPTRVGIIQALGERRDARAVEALSAEAESDDASIRQAALESLGRIGDERAEPVIAAALDRGSEREQRAAFDAYLHLGEQLRAARKRTEAHKVYIRALQAAPTEAGRTAALVGLTDVGSARDVEAVLSYLADSAPTVRHAATQCLARLPDPETARVLAEALEDSQPNVKAGLLRVLAQREEAAAAEAIEAATQDPNAEVRVTAYQLLDRLDEPGLEDTLLEAAASGSDAIHPVALAAYVRLAEARQRDNELDAARAMYTRALDLARTDGLRRMALGGLAAVPSVDSLPKVEAYLDVAAVRVEALRAYVAIAGVVAESGEQDRAIAMLEGALEQGAPRDVTQDIVARLRNLGADIDPARASGFVSCWWVIGPFPGNAIDEEFPPEQAVDLGATIKADDRELRWVKHFTTDITGVVDLAALMEPNQNTTAYLYAEVTVDQAQDVLFKMGSDDGMKCWLNGELIDRYPQPRSLTIDQDVVETRLEAAPNTILLKVVQGGGGWESCLRITDREGKRIPFTQKDQ